jgi:hypothetical protein
MCSLSELQRSGGGVNHRLRWPGEPGQIGLGPHFDDWPSLGSLQLAETAKQGNRVLVRPADGVQNASPWFLHFAMTTGPFSASRVRMPI